MGPRSQTLLSKCANCAGRQQKRFEVRLPSRFEKFQRVFRSNGSAKCVRTQEGEQMAQRIGAVAYVENSALTKEGVRNVSIR